MTLKQQLAEAFIRGFQQGAEYPQDAGDGDAMGQHFRDWWTLRVGCPVCGYEELYACWWGERLCRTCHAWAHPDVEWRKRLRREREPVPIYYNGRRIR